MKCSIKKIEDIVVYLLIAFIISLLLELFIIPRLIFVSYKRRLFDLPNDRKMHDNFISRLGGTTFFPVILISFCTTVAFIFLLGEGESLISISGVGLTQTFIQFAFLFSSLVLLYFVGIMDDMVGVKYSIKFIVQILCSAFVVGSGIYINNLHGFFGINELPTWLSYLITIPLIVFIINAFNLIDGIDGLASGLGIIALIVLCFLFYLGGMLIFSILAVTLLGCLLAFFQYNVFGSGKKNKKKIFMGDTGSYTLGLLLAFFTIRYNMAPQGAALGIPNNLVVFSVILVPCLDAMRVFIYRIKKGNHPFKPDKNHLHHLLMKRGLSSPKALVVILGLSFIMIVMNFLLINYLRLEWLLLINVVIYMCLYFFLQRKNKPAIRTESFCSLVGKDEC